MLGVITWPRTAPPKTILKTNLGSVSEVVCFERPLQLLRSHELRLLQDKMGILQGALADLGRVEKFSDIAAIFHNVIQKLFP